MRSKLPSPLISTFMLTGSPVRALVGCADVVESEIAHRSGKGRGPSGSRERLDIDRGAVGFHVNDLLLKGFCRIDEPGCVSHSERSGNKKALRG